MTLGQGNAYNLKVALQVNGEGIDTTALKQIEFMFDTVRKTYGGEGTVTYDSGEFIVPLSQEETFVFNKMIQYQARVLWNNGLVSKAGPYTADISESISQVVLE